MIHLDTLTTQLTADHCIKCNICTIHCPVAAVTDRFPGPKAVGPQMQRLRHPTLESPDKSLDYCSGCGVCSLVCPHGVQIAEMNTIARAALWQRERIPLRNRLLGRSELLGRLGSWFAPFSNWPLQSFPLRVLIEKLLGVHRRATLPRFTRRPFRGWFRRWIKKQQPETRLIGRHKVVYFHGCSTNYYEPHIGKLAVQILAHNGCKVSLARQNCCGLPMQSNGEFAAARAYARRNIDYLAPYVHENYLIVGTSTSCTLALKHDYRAILGLRGADVEAVAANTYDIFEFLEMLHQQGELDTRFRPVNRRLFYHPPCQQRSHFIGQPALRLLRMIPGVQIEQSTAACCGVAGTYGLKAEKYPLAQAVGQPLFDQIEAASAQAVLCDSETCRWWIDAHTGSTAQHPIEILARAWGITGD